MSASLKIPARFCAIIGSLGGTAATLFPARRALLLLLFLPGAGRLVHLVPSASPPRPHPMSLLALTEPELTLIPGVGAVTAQRLVRNPVADLHGSAPALKPALRPYLANP